MEKKLEMLYEAEERFYRRLGECLEQLRQSEDMSVLDIDIMDKLMHSIKSTGCSIDREEEKTGGGSAFAREGSNRSRAYEGSNRSQAYESYGNSERRGRSPRTGRFVSRAGGYSGHDGIEDIMMDVQEMPESERRKLREALERM